MIRLWACGATLMALFWPLPVILCVIFVGEPSWWTGLASVLYVGMHYAVSYSSCPRLKDYLPTLQAAFIGLLEAWRVLAEGGLTRCGNSS